MDQAIECPSNPGGFGVTGTPRQPGPDAPNQVQGEHSGPGPASHTGDVHRCAAAAAAIRRHFANLKTLQHGRTYRPAPRFDDQGTWERAAQLCNAEGAAPENFVAAAFRYNTVPGGPFPNQLAGSAMSRWYRDFRTMNVDPQTVESPLGHQLRLIIRHALQWAAQDYHGDLRRSLLDPSLWHIPAFVRCILLPQDPEIISRYGGAAYKQISANPKLLQLLQDRGYDLGFLEKYR